MDGKYAEVLRHRENVFKEHTHTKKQIFHTLITTFNLLPNEHIIGLIDTVVTMDDLFLDIDGK
jgi:hypothetical protein